MPLSPRDIQLAQESAEIFKAALSDGLQPGPAAMVAVAFETRRLTSTLERLVVIAERLADPAQAVSFMRQVGMIAENLKTADAGFKAEVAKERFAQDFGLDKDTEARR